MANKEEFENEWEDDEDHSPRGSERRTDESDADYQERMEDYESLVDYNND